MTKKKQPASNPDRFGWSAGDVEIELVPGVKDLPDETKPLPAGQPGADKDAKK